MSMTVYSGCTLDINQKKALTIFVGLKEVRQKRKKSKNSTRVKVEWIVFTFIGMCWQK